MKVKIALLRYFYLRKFLTWNSWSGFGVTTNWPDTDWETDARIIHQIFEKHLPKDWTIRGPCLAAGGAVVMYAWPKKDPNVQEMSANQDMSSAPTFDDFVEEIKKMNFLFCKDQAER